MATRKQTKRTTGKRRSNAKARAGDASTKGGQAQVVKALAPVAKEINKKLELAKQSQDKADDYQISAALLLADAKAKCEAGKVTFKKWCEDNIAYHYDSARRLVRIGRADNPKLALEDMRGRRASGMAKSRAASKGKHGDKLAARPQGSAGVTQPKQTPIEAMETILAKLDPKARDGMAEIAARRAGKAVVDPEAGKREAMRARDPVGAVVQDFERLDGSDRMKALRTMAAIMACKIMEPSHDSAGRAKERASAGSGGSMDIPDFLDRRTAKADKPASKPRQRRRKAA